MRNKLFTTSELSTIVLVVIVLVSTCVSAQEQTVGLFLVDTASFTGYTLFSQIGATSTHLIDNYGRVVHTWEAGYRPNLSVYLLSDGSILRTTKITAATERAVQKIAWDGDLLWQYQFDAQHHDIEPLPNGNVLILAGDDMIDVVAIAEGRDPSLISSSVVRLEQILEVEPTYPSGGNIVWEWHLKDHLIQDFDVSKSNYGVVGDHPELVDFNFAESGAEDWVHVNAVAYNPELDQIIMCGRVPSEFWVIDHSTTTAEAADHTGGNCGMGGDILYRWGNPQSYRAGTSTDQMLYYQHDAHWIPAGHPGEGNILIFNNESGYPDDYSSVDELISPLDMGGCYPMPATGTAHGPSDLTWTYTADTPTDFFSSKISSAQRLLNGNTLVCAGNGGRFFEVTATGDMVWEYICPLSGGAPMSQGDPVVQNNVFRCHRYAPDYSAFDGRDMTPGGSIEKYDVVISGTQHFPSTPLASDSIVLTSEITAVSAIVTAEIYVDTGNGHMPVTIYDDGNHHDDLAGDDLYGVVIPQVSESVFVSYYVYAEESAGPSSYDPPNPPSTMYSFIVGPPCGAADPVAICPSDIEVEADQGDCGAIVAFAIEATDDCPGVTVASSPPTGTFFSVGITSVEVVAIDYQDNSDTCHFDVTVSDTERPVAICPDDIALERDPGEAGAIAEFLLDATDNCSGVSVVATPASGTLFPVGTTIVEVVATDAALNKDTCYFNVTVGCCAPPSVGDLDQTGEDLPYNVSGIDLSMMIDGLFISLDWSGVCLSEADLDFSGQHSPSSNDVDGIDLSYMIDALFISLNPLPQCDGTPN